MVRTRLLDLLAAHSYRSSDVPTFKLASGKLSRHYIDCKATTMRGDAKAFVGALFAPHIPESAQSVGGLTMGADPIASAVSYFCTQQGRFLDSFAVRKEPKKHGLQKWIEGCAKRDTHVVIVDDVVTTGGSTIDAIKKCREEGLIVDAVIVLVDRQEDGGVEAIRREAGVPVVAIFTITEIEEHAHASQHSERPRSATG